MTSLNMTTRVLLGQRTDIKKNAHFVNDSVILYPAGVTLIFQNFTEKTQKYIKVPDTGNSSMELLTVSPRKNFLGVMTNSKESGQIHIYSLLSHRRKRTLTLPADATAKRFESICFTCDETYIMAVTGEPDWMMLSFNWERGKIETSAKANYLTNPSAPIREVVCSPADSSVLAIYGQGIFRLMNLQETIWRQYGFQKAENYDICSCCFLLNDRILCGTTDGLLLLIELAELRYIFEADVVTYINARADKEEEFLGALPSSMVIERAQCMNSTQDKSVRNILALNKGFAFSCGPGLVHFFEKTATHKYIKRNIYEIEEQDFREIQTTSLNEVQHLATNPSETVLIATTKRCQIYEVNLWGPEMNIAGKVAFRTLGDSLHTGPVKDLSLCYWKPIFITCGAIDRTVRVWDYTTNTLEMVKKYQEDIHSVSLHPTGLYAAIGFSDMLRFIVILIDDFQVFREFPIRECTKSTFSNCGHLLAATNRNVIQIYSITTFQNLANLRGHSDMINCLQWTSDDRKLVSCGADGAIYEWDITSFKRIGEVVTKGICYYECAVTSNGKYIYAVGTDDLLKEISASNILKSISLKQKGLNHVILSRSNLMMFIGSQQGCVTSVKIPLTETPECSTLQIFHSSVTQMKISADDQTLVTCSYNGVICIWNVENIEGKAIGIEKDFVYFKEILISKADLDEKLASIKDLSQRTRELEMEHAYQIRHAQTVFDDQIKDIRETYNQAIEELKVTLAVMESEYNNELNNISIDTNTLKEKHECDMLETEAKYNAKLIVEYNKITDLDKLIKTLTVDYESKLAVLNQSKQKTTEELTRINESKIYNLNKMVDEARDDINKETREYEEVARQTEDDNDREIETLQTNYEKMIKVVRESNIRLKGESSVLKKKIITCQKEIEMIQMNNIHLQIDIDNLKTTVRALDQEIVDLKKEISERDLRIQVKEKRIYYLKRKDQEYERYIFVLNHRKKELRNQIEPRDKQIKEKKEQISELEVELEQLQRVNISLEGNLTSLREKLNGAYKLLHIYRKKSTVTDSIAKKIRTEIYFASGNIQDYKKLREDVKKLYFKYIKDKNFGIARKNEEICIAELRRQKAFLENIFHSLRKDVEEKKNMRYGEGMLYMEMNWVLMDEIHKIQKKLKTVQSKVQDMEALLSVKIVKVYSPRQAHKIIQNALISDEELNDSCKIEMEEAFSKTVMMREEVETLMTRIKALENSTVQNKNKKKKANETLKFKFVSDT